MKRMERPPRSRYPFSLSILTSSSQPVSDIQSDRQSLQAIIVIMVSSHF